MFGSAGVILTLSLVLCVPGPALLVAAEPLLENGSFQSWENEVPVGWELSIGAQQGEGEESWITPMGEKGGLKLEGHKKTRRWRLVSQSFEVTPGKSYRLSFRARAEGLRREGRQFDNCYMGLAFFDAAGSRLQLGVRNVVEGDWMDDPLYLSAPENATRGSVLIFLSKTGGLLVERVELAAVEATPEECFRILAQDMARHYSYFEHKRIKWSRLTRHHGKKMNEVHSEAQFVSAIKPMLAKLKDNHVWIQRSDGEIVPSYRRPVVNNYDLDTVLKRVAFPRRLGKGAIVARTRDGFGYVAILSLQGDEAYFGEVCERIAQLFDAPGIIIDIRANSGGDERHAQKIASLFTSEELVYARQKTRNGPQPDDLVEGPPRKIMPAKDVEAYEGPVVCLIGPRCMSSGEGMAQMMKAIPSVTLAGMPTRGSSGNPAPVSLPNGVRVFYSRWVSLLPDGTVLEGRGVRPDVTLRHKAGPGDSTFELAWELLRRLSKK